MFIEKCVCKLYKAWLLEKYSGGQRFYWRKILLEKDFVGEKIYWRRLYWGNLSPQSRSVAW